MKRHIKTITIVVIILVVAAAIGLVLKHKKGSKASSAQTHVVVVEKGNIEVKVLATGTIEPFTRVEVRSPQSGRVESVIVEEGDWVGKGQTLAWISGQDRISLIDAANSMMQDANSAGDSQVVEQARQAQEMALKAYLPIPVTSPLRARVINRSCQPGQNVTGSDLLFALSDRLVAGVQVDETDIGKIYVGQKALITLDAFPDENRTGKTVKISQEARLVSNVVIYDVQVDPDSIPLNWSSGMTANVEFTIQDIRDVLVLPASAVRQVGMDKMVMLKGTKPRSQKIETGATDGKMIEIKSGLSEGDSVVVGGANPSNGNPTNPQASRAISRGRGFLGGPH
jgi:macrolide-specific efflux system membrane fusion protein